MDRWIKSACGLTFLALAACGGGGSGNSAPAPAPAPAPPPPPPVTRTIGGSLSGLEGSVVLQNNGAGNLTASADGAFTFATTVNDGGAFNVTVLTQPDHRQCTVANGQGTASANITNVTVSCVYADHRRWGTPVGNAWPVERGFAEGYDTVMGRDRILTAAAYINDSATPDTVSFWSGDFNPATRTWSTFEQLAQPGNTVAIGVDPLVASGAQGDVAAFRLDDLIEAGSRAVDGTWTQAAWSGEHRADNGSDVQSVTLVDGTIYLVWRDNLPGRTPQYVLSYRILRQGTWSAPQVASTQVQNTGTFLVRTDGTRAHLAWVTSGSTIQYCVLGDTGCEQPAEIQPTTSGLTLYSFLVNADGNAQALWRQNSNFRGNSRRNGVWSSSFDVALRSGGTPATPMGVASLPDGFVVLGRADNLLLARTWRNGWIDWTAIGEVHTNQLPTIAVDAQGNALVAWTARTDMAPGDYPVFFARFDAALGEWLDGGLVAEDSWYGNRVTSAVDSRGNVLLTWSSLDAPDIVLHTRLFDATEKVWRDPVEQARDAFAEGVFFDSADRGVLVWLDYSTSEWKANTFARPQ